MNEQQLDGFSATILRRMVEAGLTGAELVSAQPESAAFGDTSATFRLNGLLMRVVRDRGEEFLDLGSADEPAALFQYDDVEIAMGWRSIDEVLSKQSPEALDRVFHRMANKLPELQAAFSTALIGSTRAYIRRAECERGEAFKQRLCRG